MIYGGLTIPREDYFPQRYMMNYTNNNNQQNTKSDLLVQKPDIADLIDLLCDHNCKAAIMVFCATPYSEECEAINICKNCGHCRR